MSQQRKPNQRQVVFPVFIESDDELDVGEEFSRIATRTDRRRNDHSETSDVPGVASETVDLPVVPHGK